MWFAKNQRVSFQLWICYIFKKRKKRIFFLVHLCFFRYLPSLEESYWNTTRIFQGPDSNRQSDKVAIYESTTVQTFMTLTTFISGGSFKNRLDLYRHLNFFLIAIFQLSWTLNEDFSKLPINILFFLVSSSDTLIKFVHLAKNTLAHSWLPISLCILPRVDFYSNLISYSCSQFTLLLLLSVLADLILPRMNFNGRDPWFVQFNGLNDLRGRHGTVHPGWNSNVAGSELRSQSFNYDRFYGL